MNELKIHGHSGCGLKVVEDSDGKLLVEKSCKESYKTRLKAQYKKQLDAAHQTLGSNSIPFDVPYPYWAPNEVMLMPYVNAMSFIEYLERAGKADLDNLIKSLHDYIASEYMMSEMKDVSNKVMMDKVKSVYDNTMKNEILTDEDKETVEQACAYAITWLQKHETLSLPVGICHGDLTFSNILFRSSGKHSLIDFLDSFIETPLQDLVKVRQDTLYNWSLLMTDASYNEAHVKTALQYIDDRIVESFDKDFMKYYDILQYINILRIVPYVKEHRVYERLIKILETIEL